MVNCLIMAEYFSNINGNQIRTKTLEYGGSGSGDTMVFLHEGLDEVYQIVKPDLSIAVHFEQVDMALSFEEREAYVVESLESERKKGFDLAEGPMLRVAIFQLDDDQFDFVWFHHHILLDGWSVSIILEEFFLLYKAAQTGNPCPGHCPS